MSTATLALPAGKTAPTRSSLRRSRRWALFAFYFFLILFAIFFLMPPYYMVVTALKSEAMRLETLIYKRLNQNRLRATTTSPSLQNSSG